MVVATKGEAKWYIHPQVLTWFNEFGKDKGALFRKYGITHKAMNEYMTSHFEYITSHSDPDIQPWNSKDELEWAFFFTSMYIPLESKFSEISPSSIGSINDYNQVITNKLVVAGDYGIQYGFNEEMLDEVLRIYQSHFQEPLSDKMRDGWQWQESSFKLSLKAPPYEGILAYPLSNHFINWPIENPLEGDK